MGAYAANINSIIPAMMTLKTPCRPLVQYAKLRACFGSKCHRFTKWCHQNESLHKVRQHLNTFQPHDIHAESKATEAHSSALKSSRTPTWFTLNDCLQNANHLAYGITLSPIPS